MGRRSKITQGADLKHLELCSRRRFHLTFRAGWLAPGSLG